ncbi:MAG TPA: zf-HC2 domain-containing protein, partial [Myxococcales bacterium]|nr:zf-HC2 domain-containing protein [Myxococcales bacterium]
MNEPSNEGDEPMCDLVALYLEGALSPELEERYQRHLGTCARCQGAFQAGVLVEGLARRPQGKVLPFIRERGLPTLARMAAVLVLAVTGRVAVGLWPVDVGSGPTRGSRAWVEGPFAQAHRPFERGSQRSLGQTAEGSLDGTEYDEQRQRISWLFGHRRLLAGAASALNHGDEERAEALLLQLERSPSADAETRARASVDHAVLELQRAERLPADSCGEIVRGPEVQAVQDGVCDEQMRLLREALAYLEQALERTPGRPAALFNRALVLERLGLDLSAAEAFEAAARSAPGDWAKEAAAEAARLRLKLEQGKLFISRTQQALAALARAVPAAAEEDRAGTSAAEQAVRDAAELAHRLQAAQPPRDAEPLRMKIYELARVGTPLQRRLLVPLAEAVDGPGSALVQRLTGYAPARAPAHARLVERFQRQDQLPDQERAALATELARAGEVELLLAMLGPDPALSGRPELPVDDAFLRMARQQEPFLSVRAGRIDARLRAAGNRLDAGIQVLEQLTRSCQPDARPEMCVAVETQLLYAYATLERWSEAQAHAQRALALARRLSSSWARPTLLRLSADIASAQNEPWLALAFAEEVRRAAVPEPGGPPDPALCTIQSDAAEKMAAVHLYSLLDANRALALLGEAVQPPG